MRRTVALCLAALACAFASGKQTPLPPNVAEIAISKELAPPGGTVQLKYSLTEPRPISTGAFFLDVGALTVDGVAVSSTAPTSMGLGFVRNGRLYISAVSPAGDLGLNTDYPVVTVTMDIPANVSPGVVAVNPNGGFSVTTPTGPITTIVKPGQITIGGGAFIQNVVPGGGIWPAGTVVHLKGMGFTSATRLRTNVKTTSIQYVSPQEIAVTLRETTSLDGKSFQIQNPDNTSSEYYAYLRGTLLRAPSRTLLQSVEPAFSTQTHAVAQIGPVPDFGPAQFLGVALQNQNPGPVSVSLELRKADGNRVQSTIVLPSGTRIMDDISGLMDGADVSAGDVLRISSTSPIQILGISGDDATGTAAPVVPSFD